MLEFEPITLKTWTGAKNIAGEDSHSADFGGTSIYICGTAATKQKLCRCGDRIIVKLKYEELPSSPSAPAPSAR